MRFLIFFGTVTLLLLAIDWYTISSWKAFVRQRSWSRWWYIVPYWLMGIMLIAFPIAIISRQTAPHQTPLTLALSIAVAFWYLPKLPIVLALLIRDILRALRWGGKKLGNSVSSAKSEPVIDTTTSAESSAHEQPVSALPARREFLQTAGWSLAGVPFFMVGKGLLHTVHNFRVYRHEIFLPGLSRAFDGMTIAQLSDIHTGSFSNTAPIEEIFRITHGLKPDMILITGDWVNTSPRELSLLLPSLEKASAPLGVYGSLGNHDHYMDADSHRQFITAIRRTPVQLFVNQNTVLHIDGGKLQLAGTDNSGMDQHFADIDAALAGFSPEHPTILMAHDPTFWDAAIRPMTHVDLMLSGHTHGGQFGVQAFGKEYSVADIVYKQWAGLYRKGDKQLYVNRGVGTTAFPVRVGIDPEITLFTLRKA